MAKKRGRRSTRKKKQNTSVWRSKGVTVFLIVIVVMLGLSVAKELVRRVEVRYEVEKLEEEVARLEQRNGSMRELISVMNTSTSQEKQARQKLGLQADGEQAVMLDHRKREEEIELPDSDKIRYIPVNTYESNPEKWWNYFKEKSNVQI